ncbi:MAG: glycosyltransferase [Muribaculaceae bacterium]|nr:glycosyltransferase [Muribaculaceae bacterium]
MNNIKRFIKPFTNFLGRNYTVPWVHFKYFIRLKRKLNLNKPKDLNEKILYLSLKTNTTKWSELTDKYLVREYIKEKIGEDKLVKLLGKWDNAEDIDFEKLPNKFVLKTNHGSGEIKIVKDKSKLNIPETIKYFNKEISHPYGETEGSPHYWRIKPLIIAEELLENDPTSTKFSSSIIDYKCWCFNGRCEYIWVCLNRTKNGTDVLLYDREWNCLPQYSIFNSHYRKGIPIPKPKNLTEIIETSEALAKPFPVVRVDLYSIANRIYFGEMTFTSLGGKMNFFTKEFLEKAGSMIDLNYKG